MRIDDLRTLAGLLDDFATEHPSVRPQAMVVQELVEAKIDERDTDIRRGMEL